MERLKYFVLNKKLDYDRSSFTNMEYNDSGFWLQNNRESKAGIFISKVFDAKETEMEWHRLVIDMDNQENVPFQITINVSDSLDIFCGNKVRNINQYIKDETISAEEKLLYFSQYVRKKANQKKDILLHEVKGRYLWITIKLFHQGQAMVKITGVQVFFPKQSWLSFLPEIYEAQDTGHFLERYLCIIQTVYEELDQQIKEVPLHLDSDASDVKNLDIIVKWLSLSQIYMWPESKKRTLLKHAMPLFKIRGTRKGILGLLKIYLDDCVYMVEKKQWNKEIIEEKKKVEYQRLFGDSPYLLTLLVTRTSVGNAQEYKALLKLFETQIPVQMQGNIVVLQPEIVLGGHTYLGINSKLEPYHKACLNGQTGISYAALGGSKERM